MECFLENMASVSAAYLKLKCLQIDARGLRDGENETQNFIKLRDDSTSQCSVPFPILRSNLISHDGASWTEQPTVLYGNVYLFWVFLRMADGARNRISPFSPAFTLVYAKWLMLFLLLRLLS